MRGKSQIGFCDKLLVKSFLARARFVSSNKQDRFTLRIERECGAPLAVHRLESQLLHIGVLRTFERIGVRPPELRAIVGKQLR